MAGKSFSFVVKYGLYSERYRTRASCSSTSILLREIGGRAIYCARASRVLDETAGLPPGYARLPAKGNLTDMSTLKPL
jgi:hypothetical protein